MFTLIPQFLPQGFDMGIDRPCCSLKVVAPNPIKQLVSAEYLAGINHEEMQQFIFLVGQSDFLMIVIFPAFIESVGVIEDRRSKAPTFASNTLGLNGLVI